MTKAQRNVLLIVAKDPSADRKRFPQHRSFVGLVEQGLLRREWSLYGVDYRITDAGRQALDSSSAKKSRSAPSTDAKLKARVNALVGRSSVKK